MANFKKLPVKKYQLCEIDLIIKLHYYISSNNLNLNKFVKFMRSSGFKSFSRHFFYNIFRGKRFGFTISIVFCALEYINISLIDLLQIEVPESYKRKLLK